MFVPLICFLIPTLTYAKAFPGSIHAAGTLEAGGIVPPITLDKGGNVGVNFGGYHASAGLGGLLTGDYAKGGLHAEAGTPYGQSAAAGLGGGVGGGAGGGLFAGATAGGGIAAGAGLVGETHNKAEGAVAIEGEVRTHGKEVLVEETKVKGPPQVHRTIIEKTVIPNYVEKKVQETHYVEKTIRVPQVVEKTIRVPVAPTVIEKHIEVPVHHVEVAPPVKKVATFEAGLHVGAQAAPAVAVVEKQAPAQVSVEKYASGGYGHSASSGLAGGFAGSAGIGGGSAYGVRKSSSLFTDIFNIPISTLGAVSNLLSGIGGVRAGGAFGVSKHYAAGVY